MGNDKTKLMEAIASSAIARQRAIQEFLDADEIWKEKKKAIEDAERKLLDLSDRLANN